MLLGFSVTSSLFPVARCLPVAPWKQLPHTAAHHWREVTSKLAGAGFICGLDCCTRSVFKTKEPGGGEKTNKQTNKPTGFSLRPGRCKSRMNLRLVLNATCFGSSV